MVDEEATIHTPLMKEGTTEISDVAGAIEFWQLRKSRPRCFRVHGRFEAVPKCAEGKTDLEGQGRCGSHSMNEKGAA